MNRENIKKYGFKKGNDNQFKGQNFIRQSQNREIKNESVEEGEIISQKNTNSPAKLKPTPKNINSSLFDPEKEEKNEIDYQNLKTRIGIDILFNQIQKKENEPNYIYGDKNILCQIEQNYNDSQSNKSNEKSNENEPEPESMENQEQSQLDYLNHNHMNHLVPSQLNAEQLSSDSASRNNSISEKVMQNQQILNEKNSKQNTLQKQEPLKVNQKNQKEHYEMSGEEAEMAELFDEEGNENQGNDMKVTHGNNLQETDIYMKMNNNYQQNNKNPLLGDPAMEICSSMSEECELDVQSGQLNQYTDEEDIIDSQDQIEQKYDQQDSPSLSVNETAQNIDINSSNLQQIQQSIPKNMISYQDERTISEIEATIGKQQIDLENQIDQQIKVQKYGINFIDEKMETERYSEIPQKNTNAQRISVKLGFADQFSESQKSEQKQQESQNYSQIKVNVQTYQDPIESSLQSNDNNSQDQFKSENSQMKNLLSSRIQNIYKSSNKYQQMQQKSQISLKSQNIEEVYLQDNSDQNELDIDNFSQIKYIELKKNETAAKTVQAQNQYLSQNQQNFASASKNFKIEDKNYSMEEKSKQQFQDPSRISINIESIEQEDIEKSSRSPSRKNSGRRSRKNRQQSKISKINEENEQVESDKDDSQVNQNLTSQLSLKNKNQNSQAQKENQSRKSQLTQKSAKSKQTKKSKASKSTFKEYQQEIQKEAKQPQIENSEQASSEIQKDEIKTENNEFDEKNSKNIDEEDLIQVEKKSEQEDQNKNDCMINIEQNFVQNDNTFDNQGIIAGGAEDYYFEDDVIQQQKSDMEEEEISNDDQEFIFDDQSKKGSQINRNSESCESDEIPSNLLEQQSSQQEIIIEDQNRSQDEDMVQEVEQIFVDDQQQEDTVMEEESEQDLLNYDLKEEQEDLQKDSVDDQQDFNVQHLSKERIENQLNSENEFEENYLDGENVEQIESDSQNQSSNKNESSQDEISQQESIDISEYIQSENKQQQYQIQEHNEDNQIIEGDQIVSKDSEKIENFSEVNYQAEDVEMKEDESEIQQKDLAKSDSEEEEGEYIPSDKSSSSQIDSSELISEEIIIEENHNESLQQNQELKFNENNYNIQQQEEIINQTKILKKKENQKIKKECEIKQEISPRRTRGNKILDVSIEKQEEQKPKRQIEKFTIVRRPKINKSSEKQEINLDELNAKQKTINITKYESQQFSNKIKNSKKKQSEEVEKIDDEIDHNLVLSVLKINASRRSNLVQETKKSPTNDKEKLIHKSPLKNKEKDYKQKVIEKIVERKLTQNEKQKIDLKQKISPTVKNIFDSKIRPLSPPRNAYQNQDKMIQIQSFQIHPKNMKMNEPHKFERPERRVKNEGQNYISEVKKTNKTFLGLTSEDEQFTQMVEEKKKKNEPKQFIQQKKHSSEIQEPIKLRNSNKLIKDQIQNKAAQPVKGPSSIKQSKEEQQLQTHSLFGFLSNQEQPKNTPKQKLKTPSPQIKSKKIINDRKSQQSPKKFRDIAQSPPRELRSLRQEKFVQNAQNIEPTKITRQLRKQSPIDIIVKNETQQIKKEIKKFSPQITQSVSKLPSKKSFSPIKHIEKEKQIIKEKHVSKDLQKPNQEVCKQFKKPSAENKKKEEQNENHSIRKRDQKQIQKSKIEQRLPKAQTLSQSPIETIKTRNLPKPDYASLALGYIQKPKQKEQIQQDKSSKQISQKLSSSVGLGFCIDDKEDKAKLTKSHKIQEKLLPDPLKSKITVHSFSIKQKNLKTLIATPSKFKILQNKNNGKSNKQKQNRIKYSKECYENIIKTRNQKQKQTIKPLKEQKNQLIKIDQKSKKISKLQDQIKVLANREKKIPELKNQSYVQKSTFANSIQTDNSSKQKGLGIQINEKSKFIQKQEDQKPNHSQIQKPKKIASLKESNFRNQNKIQDRKLEKQDQEKQKTLVKRSAQDREIYEINIKKTRNQLTSEKNEQKNDLKQKQEKSNVKQEEAQKPKLIKSSGFGFISK